jgi:hypothetical protein
MLLRVPAKRSQGCSLTRRPALRSLQKRADEGDADACAKLSAACAAAASSYSAFVGAGHVASVCPCGKEPAHDVNGGCAHTDDGCLQQRSPRCCPSCCESCSMFVTSGSFRTTRRRVHAEGPDVTQLAAAMAAGEAETLCGSTIYKSLERQVGGRLRG